MSTLPPSLNPPGDRKARPQPRPVPHLVGNRDWFILLECRGDSLVVYPSGRRFTTQELNTDPQAGKALLEAVRQMIAHRQAMVRPGEPPWRPQMRFLVRPDGVRTFYLAYPLLEPAGAPMTRHNLDADEEIR